MTKSTITSGWIGGLAIFAGGIVVAVVGVFLMLAYGGRFTPSTGTTGGYDFTPALNGFFWTAVGMIVVGGVLGLIGSLVQLAAWVGALVNSYALPDRTWFAVLLVGGILSLAFAPVGFAVMLAFVVAAPDGSAYQRVATPRAAPMVPAS